MNTSKMVQPKMDAVKNATYSEIKVGDRRNFSKIIGEAQVRQFAMLSGDCNPTHLDPIFAIAHGLSGTVIHKMHISMILSGYFGNEFPGHGTDWKEQDIRFFQPIYVGEKLDFELEVLEKIAPRDILIRIAVTNPKGEVVAKVEERLEAPIVNVEICKSDLPYFYMSDRKILLDKLLGRARTTEIPTMAVAWPLNKESLLGAIEAKEAKLVIPVFFGPEKFIRQNANEFGIDLDGILIMEAANEEEACELSAKAVGRNEHQILAKGSPHSDHFLASILKRENGLRKHDGDGILSHVFYVDGIPPLHGESTSRTLVITDGALNIAPTLMQKKGIAQNAIDFLRTMGTPKPLVAVLAAVEVVNQKMPATLDAKELTNMSLRGQITGGIVEGPLAFDVATNPDAARAKGIISEVAGRADILLCPTIEVANVAAKEYEQMNALTAGVLCGAEKPIVLTSRSDDAINRLASVAIACILLQEQRDTKS